MMEGAQDIAKEAVLVRSEAVPEGTPVVQGNYNKFIWYVVDSRENILNIKLCSHNLRNGNKKSLLERRK